MRTCIASGRARVLTLKHAFIVRRRSDALAYQQQRHTHTHTYTNKWVYHAHTQRPYRRKGKRLCVCISKYVSV
jgi:hypothetical protein